MADENTKGTPAAPEEVVQRSEQHTPAHPAPSADANPPPVSKAPLKEDGGEVIIRALNSPTFHENMLVKRWSGFYSSGRYDHYLRLSYVLTACFVCCCALTSLPFTLPAIYFAKMARRAEAKRDVESMIRNERIALALNMVGMAAYVALFVSIIIVIVVMEGHIIMAYEPSS
eukprot:Em0003g1555a